MHSAPSWQSAIYRCRVMHQRFYPKPHHLEYEIFMLGIHLDELEALGKSLRLFSYRSACAPVALLTQDHLPLGGKTLRENAILALSKFKKLPEGYAPQITLLTMPRVLGYAFNPITIFYFTDPLTGTSDALAEVENTFRERKIYHIPQDGDIPRKDSTTFIYRQREAKHYYVSPFIALDAEFDFEITSPHETVRWRVDSHEKNGSEKPRRVLTALLQGKRERLSDANLFFHLIRFPLLPLRVMAAIHWHALLLFLKKIPFYRKRDRLDLQQDVLLKNNVSTTHDS